VRQFTHIQGQSNKGNPMVKPAIPAVRSDTPEARAIVAAEGAG
jgi:hypothetical protein